jgi:FkbM family methyltransferase
MVRLAYDVGAHDGSDSAHYLSLGYSVVAIEASPLKVDILERRFAHEIERGKLKLLNIAVGDRPGVLPFFLSSRSLWSSFDRNLAARDGSEVTEIQIETRILADVVRDHGDPEFLKIDVEGADYACLRTMGATPRYLSYEADQQGGAEMILHLIQQGYTAFSLIDQHSSKPVAIAPPGTLRGVKWALRQYLRLEMRKRPYIHDVLKALTPKHRHANVRPKEVPPVLTPMEHEDGWHSPAEFLWLWQNVVASGIIDSSWFDVHARK